MDTMFFYINITQFDGKRFSFDDCAFASTRTIRSVIRPAYELMESVENETNIHEEDIDSRSPHDVQCVSAELYAVVSQACAAEGLQVLRPVEGTKGLTAWPRFYQSFNWRTLVRAFCWLVRAVTNPTRVKDITDAESAIDKWETVKSREKDLGEKFCVTVRAAIVARMMRQSVQEFMSTAIQEKIDYNERRLSRKSEHVFRTRLP